MKQRRLPKIFPGWWLVVTGSFLNLWGAGYSIYGFSALFKPLSTELGFSRAVTSVAASITRLEGGLEGPVVGWLTDRFGPRWIILLGISLFSLGLMLMYFVNSLWAFYLIWGVIVGTGSNIAQGLPINTAITNWFVKKRGLALGIRLMLSAVLMLPLITWFITRFGWRMACVFGGLGLFLVGFPLAWFSVKRHRPEYYGLLPDGAKAEEKIADASQMIEKGVKYAEEVEEIEFTLRQAMRTPAYWLLIIAQVFPGAALSSMLVHVVPFLTDMGMSPVKAATTVTLAGFATIVSRFVSGFVADRVRKQHLRFLLGGACLLQSGGITIFLLTRSLAMVYPFLVLFFLGGGVNSIIMSVTGGRYFGRKAFASIRGTSATATMPFGMLVPVYFGWVFDATGSYIIAFTTLAVLLLFSAFLMLLARPPKPPTVITDVRQIL